MTTMISRAAAVSAVALAWCALGCSSSSDSAPTDSPPAAPNDAGSTGDAQQPGADGGAPGADGTRYVLVNGAFLGAWSWDGVAARLTAQGAKVTAVELPAHGADATAVSGATLAAYVSKVEGAIDAAGGPVVLVGHSLAGIVISQVAEEKADRIQKLVYVAAFVPQDGQSAQDLAGADKTSHFGPALTIDPTHGTASIPLDKLEDIFCADCSPDTIHAIQSHYRDEPVAPIATPVHLTPAGWGKVSKFYVYTKQDNAISWTAQQAMTTGVSFVSTATLDSSHSPFLSKPDDLVATLIDFQKR